MLGLNQTTVRFQRALDLGQLNANICRILAAYRGQIGDIHLPKFATSGYLR